MAAPNLHEEQLLELLIQLRKTTPDQARGILSAQTQISYALMSLMVKLGVVNLEVLQKTLASYTATSAQAPVSAAPQAPPPTVPSHLLQSQYRIATPQTHQPAAPVQNSVVQPPVHQAYANGHTAAAPAASGYTSATHGYGGAPSSNTATLPDPLAHMPDEQRAMILRVVAMTPDQINRLPPNERASIIQLRTTLGLPTE